MSKRLIAFFCAFCIASLSLLFRIGTIASNEVLLNTANTQSKVSLEFNKTRGQIYDCKLIALTDVEKSYVAACVPTDENLIDLLNTTALKPTVPIGKLIDNGKPFLVPSIFPQTSISDVEILTLPKRYGEFFPARHVVGYTDLSGKGITGIERAFDEQLSKNSAKSKISFELDGLGKPLVGIPPTLNYAPILNEGVVLTIDSRLQKICEEVGAQQLKKGAIVIMEPKTGKLKAVASFPSYDINSLESAMSNSENSPLINRAFYAYNVGSTFKIVTAAAALSQGISADTSFVCNGELDVFGQKFGCHQKSGHGKLDLKSAIEVSCNPYFIQLGLALDKQSFRNMALDMSFSKQSDFATGFSSQKGYLPTLAELYNPADIANISFGQGLLMATPVQVAQMVSAIVNGGGTPSASLVEGYSSNGKIVDDREKLIPPVKCIEQAVAKKIEQFLIGCVMEVPNQHAKPKYVTAGGKTGTAQTGQFKPNGDEILQGWFAGFFPAEEPEYVVVVLSEDARSGNQDASPIFAQIADKLNQPHYYPAEH